MVGHLEMQSSASCFGLPCSQAEFEGLQGQTIPLCECCPVCRSGKAQGAKEQCVTLKSKNVEGYLLAELVEASKASLGKSSSLPVLFLPVHSFPSPTFWDTGFASLLFTGCRGVLGYYQHLFLFGLTQVFCLIFILLLSTHIP